MQSTTFVTSVLSSRHYGDNIKPANLFAKLPSLARDINGIHDVILSGKRFMNPRSNKHCNQVCYQHEMTSEVASRLSYSKDISLAITNQWEKLVPPACFFVLHSDTWV